MHLKAPDRVASGPAMDPRPAVSLTSVRKTFGTGSRAVVALHDVTWKFGYGTFTAVMGPSGSGKSTLLHCAAGLDRPTSGSVRLAGVELATLSERALTKMRRVHVGFVFQAFNLVNALTVEQNVTLPLRLAGVRADRAWIAETLGRVGLAERGRHRPAQLSGGQQQRVAVARALASRPDVIFADEPTGALDIRTGRGVLALLRQAVSEFDQTVIMVTHDPVAASFADRVVFLADGRLAGVIDQPRPEQVVEHLTHLTVEP